MGVSKIDFVNSGSYLTAVLIEVFGITTLAGLGGSFFITGRGAGLMDTSGFTGGSAGFLGAAGAGLASGFGAGFTSAFDAGLADFGAGVSFTGATFLGAGLATGLATAFLGAGFAGATAFLGAGFTALAGAAFLGGRLCRRFFGSGLSCFFRCHFSYRLLGSGLGRFGRYCFFRCRLLGGWFLLSSHI